MSAVLVVRGVVVSVRVHVCIMNYKESVPFPGKNQTKRSITIMLIKLFSDIYNYFHRELTRFKK